MISTTCLENYSDLGRLIETDACYDPPESVGSRMDHCIGWETDRVKEMSYLGEVKAWAKAIRMMEDNRPKMYAYILRKLSRESMGEYKHHTYYDLIRGRLSPL